MQSIGTIRLGMRRAGRVALGAAAFAVAAAALGSTFGGSVHRPAPRAPEAVAAAPVVNAWTDLPDAPRRYVLGDNLFGREPGLYSVRRHVGGGGRLDQLAFGSPADGSPYLRLTFYRPLDEPVGNVSFWLEMARRAGEAGLALERAPPVPEVLRTRLGPFEVGSLQALGPDGSRTCLGFRRQSHSPELIVSGVACLGDGAADPVFAREALACALEAITVEGAEEDAALRRFFAPVEPAVCGAGRRMIH